jgi:hypothetical protein
MLEDYVERFYLNSERQIFIAGDFTDRIRQSPDSYRDTKRGKSVHLWLIPANSVRARD